MSRRTRNIWAGAFVTGFVAIAVLLLPALMHGYDARQATPSGKLVMHEWGTFTSFAGSDGVNLEFRPLVTNDLPRFVMNSHWQSGVNPFLKEQYMARSSAWRRRSRTSTPTCRAR